MNAPRCLSQSDSALLMTRILFCNDAESMQLRIDGRLSERWRRQVDESNLVFDRLEKRMVFSLRGCAEFRHTFYGTSTY